MLLYISVNYYRYFLYNTDLWYSFSRRRFGYPIPGRRTRASGGPDPGQREFHGRPGSGGRRHRRERARLRRLPPRCHSPCFATWTHLQDTQRARTAR